MDRADSQAASRTFWSMALTLSASLSFNVTVRAADLSGLYDAPFDGRSSLSPAPRYFPRGDGEEAGIRLPPPRRYACAPRRVPIPTNAPDDPSYVGSEYGLSKPSYYGFRPPLGVDDPSGRPLRYCP